MGWDRLHGVRTGLRNWETVSDRLVRSEYFLYLWFRQASKGRALVNLDDEAVRLGEHEYSFSEFNYARLNSWGKPASRSLTFKFGIEDEVDFEVALTKGHKVVIAPATADAVLRLLEASSVVIPTDEFDPESKFARSGSPTNVTRDEALALITNPPMPGDKLPIIWP